MGKITEHTLLAIAGSAFIYFCYWAWKDIKREKRPPVTDDMINEAFNRMLDDNDIYILPNSLSVPE